MFTGIVEERGTVTERERGRLVVEARTVIGDCGPGSSVAVNGVCLTVVAVAPPTDQRPRGTLAFDLAPETLARTSLGALEPGRFVNLERPVTLLSRLGGHLVQGHVDGVGRVTGMEEVETGRELSIEAPEGMDRYVVEKGSIAVDGVSLTVATVRDGTFGVALVPHTLAVTTLGTTRVGDAVNLEVDVMAKYAEGLLRGRA
jgi:riboflavin synthase